LNPHTARPDLDRSVESALEHLRDLGLEGPRVLYLLGTGASLFADLLDGARAVPLADVPGVPELWREETLYQGTLGGASAWVLEDRCGDPAPPAGPWESGFPAWLAAAAGAGLAVITCAGRALPREESDAAPAGALVLACDHVNLSGGSPLIGLGTSELGPLFPDQTFLHDADLRVAALTTARERGLDAREGVAALTAGPALETEAEAAWLGRTGADVAVQGIAGPVLACAHAGLGVLVVCAVTDAGLRPVDVGALALAAQDAAPALEELLVALAPEAARIARTRED
jgi:purine-nucleoside phosphorylase